MLPVLEQLQPSGDAAITYRAFDAVDFPFCWHVHPEHELTLITRGQGTRFVGDHINPFEPGEVVLLAGQVPHTWQSRTREPGQSGAVVIQFAQGFLGPGLFEQAAMQPLLKLLGAAQRGLLVTGPVRAAVADRMRAMHVMREAARAIELLAILETLSTCEQLQTLSQTPHSSMPRDEDQRRIDRVLRFLADHAAESLTQADVASVAHLSPSAFARFFKRMTGRTLTEYLHYLRVGLACQLLMATDLPIIEVGMRSGFNNPANFHRIFRRLRRESPLQFRSRFASQGAIPIKSQSS